MQNAGLKIGFVATQCIVSLPPTARDGGFGARSKTILNFRNKGRLLKKTKKTDSVCCFYPPLRVGIVC